MYNPLGDKNYRKGLQFSDSVNSFSIEMLIDDNSGIYAPITGCIVFLQRTEDGLVLQIENPYHIVTLYPLNKVFASLEEKVIRASLLALSGGNPLHPNSGNSLYPHLSVSVYDKYKETFVDPYQLFKNSSMLDKLDIMKQVCVHYYDIYGTPLSFRSMSYHADKIIKDCNSTDYINQIHRLYDVFYAAYYNSLAKYDYIKDRANLEVYLWKYLDLRKKYKIRTTADIDQVLHDNYQDICYHYIYYGIFEGRTDNFTLNIQSIDK